MNGPSGQMTNNGTYPERAAARSAAQQTHWYSCAKRIERALVDLPQEVTSRAGRKKPGAGDVTDFGCAAVVTGSLVDKQKPVEAGRR